MIAEIDLQEAIAECQGQRNPNANTCIKLAAYLIIQRELYGNPEQLPTLPPVSDYSYAAAPNKEVETTIYIDSDSELAQAANGKDADKVWAVMDELMAVLSATQPRLYAGVLRKIEE